MKPTKNRVYCRDCARQKILFETEKKAGNFMKFNNEDIRAESGYSPNRSYYCISCGGWHVTSKEEALKKSNTEIVLEMFELEKEKKQRYKEEKARRRMRK